MALGGGGLEELTSGGVQAAIAAAFDAKQKFSFSSADLQNPNNADWNVNALAPAAADSNNAGFSVRLFDDTAQEGVGWQLVVPSGASNMTISFISRAETAPAGTRQVGLRLAQRGLADNGAVDAWDPLPALTDIDLPTNELWQYDSQTFSMATVNATPGELTQFELIRIPPVGTNLTGDWALLEVGVEFD